MPRPTRYGLLLVGHGTREPAGIRQFFDVATQLALLANAKGSGVNCDYGYPTRRPVPQLTPDPFTQYVVEPAFLELAQPDIETSVQHLADQSVQEIVIIPLLLFAAAHIKLDIPAAVGAAAAGDALPWRQADHLGCHRRIIELSRQRFREAIAGQLAVRPEKTLHLLVGRGTSDPEAIAEVQRFKELRADPSAAATTNLAFLAVAKPLLAEELQRIARQGFSRIVVQPHLLFEGELVNSITAQAAEMAAATPQTQWLVTPVLADPPGKSGPATAALAATAFDQFVRSIRVVASARDD